MQPHQDTSALALSAMLASVREGRASAASIRAYAREVSQELLLIDSALVAQIGGLLFVRAVLSRKDAIRNWWGHSGSTATTRRYVCYLCGALVATDSAKNRPTKHALSAVTAHAAQHEQPA